ncbi:retinitis pigmentosa 1-like 1 protein [Oncorhynchus nerka]|uniref:retinitis pigmentosa 1-like 1 protein n=1 Tax=Oncorhynchus nerka TaxID=8023 RepID=UPI0031B85809
MQSAPAGLWDPHGPQSKDVSSLPVHTPSASRLSHVTAAPPTKRITFYKSGDAKFAGVRMAVHKRSFKCFDALLDDLSQKVPLPFGVRTVTTPRGIHSIKHLEQLEDGGCYLCSDRRQAKPINIELAGKRPALWHHNSRRVPQRPAEDPPPPSAPSHAPTRQRRILLVRNSDPAVRRSVILSRRSARSLRVFLEGISEIMQCHVRKLYTLEGRKIDSAQSLMTCPGVLVCVGREPFRPLLLNYVAKHSEEKLPGLGTRSPGNGARSPGTGARSPRNGQGARSRSSVCSEGHGSKKNVNFGLETKKTIIHPLSDSSNRSTRFSLSSDKSYPNGLSSQGGKEAVLNDDIEKRVLVNKDGSLSVEMRVRFRLHNDERLQWSTEIKKSPSDSLTNDCCPLREAPPCFLQQGQSESCSDPDSASCVVEAADYTPKPPQRPLEEPQSHYACCFQRQEYDLWENPAHIQTSKHSHSRVRHTHSSSSSSSCRSSKLVRRRATHRECSELGRVVNGMVEVCTVSSSCSHSELNLGATDNQGEERPLSCSSHVLQALQDDVDDLPPSVSRCCHSNDPPQALPLTPQPPSPMSTSSRSRKHTPALQGEERGRKTSSRRSSNSCSCCRGEVTPKADEERVDSSLSKASQASHRSRSPSNRIRIPVAPEEGDDEAEQGGKRAVSVSGGSGGSIGSVGSIGSSVCSHCGGCDQGYDPVSCHSQKSHRSKRSQEEEEEERSGRGLSGGSDECGFSQRTNKSNCTHFYQDGRAASMMSHMSLPEEGEDTGPEGEDTGKEGEVEVGEKIEEGEKDERAANVLSAKSFSSVKGRTSRTSQKSKASESLADMEEQMEEPMEGEEKEGKVEDGSEQRAASIMSVKSNLSAKSSRSHTSTCSKADGSTKASERASSPRSEPDVAEDTGAAETEERGASVMSAKTNTSANSSRPHKSTKSPNAGAASASSETPDINAIETTGEGEEEEVGEKTDERLESSMSVRSNLSAKSLRSCKSTCSKAEQVLSAYSPEVPATEPEPTGEDEGEERATISTSVKSNLSAKSNRSHKSTCSRSIRVVSPKPAASETLVNDPADVVAAGALSAKTNASAKSRRSCKSTGDDEGEEREARAMSAKTRASIKFSRTHKSACKAASPKPAACETPVNDPEEKTEGEKTASALSAKTSASVRSSRSHKSTCSRSVRAETPVAKDIPAIETTEGDENGSAAAGETEERQRAPFWITIMPQCKAERAPSSNSPEVPATEPEPTGDDEGEKRAASATSKSSRSLQSTCSRNVWAETPGTKDIPVIATTGGEEMVDDTTAAGDTEERPPSAISAKTSASVKSSRSHKSTCSRRAESQRSQPADVPVIETTGREEVGEKKERADSVMSAKSNASAMSRKSNRPTCNGSSRAVSPVVQDVPAIETTSGKEHRDKSTASVKTNRSHKSSSGRRTETPTAEQADVNETTGRDEKGEGTERPASAMSTKYSASAKSSKSHKSTCNSGSARAISPAPKTADVPAIETTGVDREGEKTEERPASAMLAKSYISAKSSTSHTSNGSNRSTFLHLKKERGERGVRPAPSTTGNDLETGSVKSAKPKRNADSSTRPLSTASQANAKSTNQTPPATTETKEESQSHATSRPASTAAHRDDDVRDHVTEKKAPSVHSKSPAKAEGDSRAASFARSTRSKVKVQKASEAQDDEMPETRASLMQVKGHRVKAQSDTGSVHSVKTSKTDKIVIKGNSKPKSAQAGNTTSQSFNPPEGSRPAIQLALQGQRLASLIVGRGKSGSSQRRRKLKQEEVELEKLGPLCLPKTSPIDIVSDWLRGIPADSGMDNPEDEMNEVIEETEVKREEGDEKGGETEGQGGEETEEKQEPIETTEMEQENTAETGKQEEEEEQENTAETGQQEEEEEQEKTAEKGQQEEEEEQENMAETGQQEEEEEQENMAETGQEEEENTAETGKQEEEEEQENKAETGQQEEEEEEEQENTAETGQQEEEEEQENMAETGQQEEEEEQENTAETGKQDEEEEQENTAETGQQEEEEEQENMAETGKQEEEEEQENTAETGKQDEEEEQENTAETGQQEEEEEQENMAETGKQEEEEEQENTAETGQQEEEEEEEQENTAETGQQEEEEEEEQENTAETGQQEEEEEQENTAETGQQEEEEEEEQENTAETGQQEEEEEEEQENTAETGQQEEEEEQENTAETGQQEEEEEEEQENTAETGQQEEEEEEEQENTAETGQQEEEEEEEQENMAETGQEEEEQENMPETGQQDEEIKKAARQPEEEGEVKEEEEERGEEEEEAAVGEKEKKDKEEEEVKKEEEGEVGAEEEGECSECADCCPDPAPPNNDISSPCHRHLFLSRESELPWSCHSSVAVMKVLLNPTLGRCSSLPEISPVYGRRLSSSAKGLLDCLAQLQLIDPPPSPAAAPGPDRDQRYQEVMDILESLWLSKPDLEKRKEGETEEKERLKDSGVDLSSGSAGSGGSGKTRPDEPAGDITLIAKGEGGEGGGEGETDGGGGGEGETDRGGEGEGETDGGGEGEIDGGGEGEIDGGGEGETDGAGEGEVGEGETDGGGEGETDGGGEGEIDGGGEGETDGAGEGEVGEGETDGGGEGETDGGGEGEIDGGGEGETDGGGEGETDGGGEGETYGGGEGEIDGGGEGETDGGGEEATSAELLSDAATPDIASQVQSSPGEDESSPESPPGTGEMLQTLERLKTPGSPSSSDSTAYKSPTDTETDTPEDTPNSGTPPSVQRALLTKRVSQDPDPVWVLNLLKKLEKQFMTHYVDAMAELKVRWDLDNNVMLDTMITELRDEVKKRIQMSIDRELRKIRGRAGRGPRPPNMSRESTVTDQRRRRLKVMKVQSVNESDGEQGSGDVSDQRSEDEYCPCDACIRKKAEDKAIKMEAVVAKAPVMMAFDLRKILQMKKDTESPAPPSPTQGKNNDKLEEEEEQVGNLEVVQEDEEEEERKEDILPTVIEEDISEKEEEGVTGGEEGEEEGQESHGAESLMGEVEEEIAEEIGAEEQEEDGVVEGTEDEEEEAGEGETGCESAGEDGVEGAETGEGEELVEGEEEEAGEAEAGDQEKAGGDEAGDQEEAAGDEETGVAGETGGEEKTPEEETEVNVGVSAEDGEEGGEEEVQLNAVAEFNPEDEEGEEMEGNREIPLIHQMTRTSVESQPGSMENTDPEPRASDPVSQMCSLTLIEPNEPVSDGHQMASAGEGSGGKGQRRSRSPARTKRRKPKENGIELDVLDL